MAKTFDHLVSRTMSKTSQKRVAERTKVLLPNMLLSELRKATGYSQKTLTTKLKMTQPSLSKLENARDMQVTTLQKLVSVLGARWKSSASSRRVTFDSCSSIQR